MPGQTSTPRARQGPRPPSSSMPRAPSCRFCTAAQLRPADGDCLPSPPPAEAGPVS